MRNSILKDWDRSVIINTIKSDVLLGTDQQQKKNLSSFSQPHFVSNLFFFFVEHKGTVRLFMFLFSMSKNGEHLKGDIS